MGKNSCVAIYWHLPNPHKHVEGTLVKNLCGSNEIEVWKFGDKLCVGASNFSYIEINCIFAFLRGRARVWPLLNFQKVLAASCLPYRGGSCLKLKPQIPYTCWWRLGRYHEMATQQFWSICIEDSQKYVHFLPILNKSQYKAKREMG